MVSIYPTSSVETLSIAEILEQEILSPSMISLDEAWQCDSCKLRGYGCRYTKFLRLLEKAIIVHVNRICELERKSDQQIKISKRIRIQGSILSLRALVEHIGGATSGHYICYRRLRSGRWAMTSDATVQYLRSPPHLMEPYLLLYELIEPIQK